MTEIKPIPEGFGPITPHLHIKDAAAAIDFYKNAFGAKEVSRMPMPDNPSVLMHAEIRIFGAPVMMVESSEEWGAKDPLMTGGSTVTLHLYVEDCDAVYKRAVDAGCRAVMEPQDMFWGDRFCGVVDPYGHKWTIATHIADPTPEEMAEAAKKMFSG